MWPIESCPSCARKAFAASAAIQERPFVLAVCPSNCDVALVLESILIAVWIWTRKVGSFELMLFLDSLPADSSMEACYPKTCTVSTKVHHYQILTTQKIGHPPKGLKNKVLP
jgi:hypothetical protein